MPELLAKATETGFPSLTCPQGYLSKFKSKPKEK